MTKEKNVLKPFLKLIGAAVFDVIESEEEQRQHEALDSKQLAMPLYSRSAILSSAVIFEQCRYFLLVYFGKFR